MFMVRDNFSNSDESDTQQYIENESIEEQKKQRDNGTIVEEDESKSSTGRTTEQPQESPAPLLTQSQETDTIEKDQWVEIVDKEETKQS